ncbi:MAG: polysaccharide biosynthesis C-terminal domain-containing protein [bacterium]
MKTVQRAAHTAEMKNGNAAKAEMAQEGKTLVRHSMVYGLGIILNRLIGFIMIPIYTRLLTPADYGTLELLGLSTDIIGMVISVGIANAMYRFYFEFEDERERNAVISTAFATFGGIGLLCLGLLSLATGFLSRVILDAEQYASYFLVALTSIWFLTVVQMGFDYLRMRQKSVLFLIVSTLKLLLALGLNIYLVVYLRMGVMGILLSTLISSVVMTIVFVVPILVQTGPHISPSIAAKLIRFGAPLIPANLGSLIVHASDRYFLKYFGDLHQTGIYSLGYKFGNLPNTFVTSPFMQIWTARRFEVYKKPYAEEMFGAIFTYFCLLITFVGLGISMISREALEIIANPSFWDAHQVIPIIIFAYIVFSLHNHFNMGILIEKKTHYLAYINGSNGIVNLVLNWFFIQRWGMYGAAYATLLSFFYKVIVTYAVSSRIYPVHFEAGKVLKIFLTAGLLYAASQWIPAGPIYVRLGIKGLLLLAYPVLLWFLGVPGPEDRGQILSFARSKLPMWTGLGVRT